MSVVFASGPLLHFILSEGSISILTGAKVDLAAFAVLLVIGIWRVILRGVRVEKVPRKSDKDGSEYSGYAMSSRYPQYPETAYAPPFYPQIPPY